MASLKSVGNGTSVPGEDASAVVTAQPVDNLDQACGTEVWFEQFISAHAVLKRCGEFRVHGTRVKPGDEVSVKAKSKDNMSVEEALEARTRPSLMDWLALDEKARTGRMVRVPARTDIPLAANEQLIVELYSK